MAKHLLFEALNGLVALDSSLTAFINNGNGLQHFGQQSQLHTYVKL